MTMTQGAPDPLSTLRRKVRQWINCRLLFRPHKFGEWIALLAPTRFALMRDCEVCGHTQITRTRPRQYADPMDDIRPYVAELEAR